jgi:hypothetical protein
MKHRDKGTEAEARRKGGNGRNHTKTCGNVMSDKRIYPARPLSLSLQVCIHFLAGLCPRYGPCHYVHPVHTAGWDQSLTY